MQEKGFNDLLDKQASADRMFGLCKFYGVKNKELARFLDVSEETVSRCRQGKLFPSLEKIMMFAYAFGVDLDTVLRLKKIPSDNLVASVKKKARAARRAARIEQLKEKMRLSDISLFYDRIEPCYWNPFAQRYVSGDSMGLPSYLNRRDIAVYNVDGGDGASGLPNCRAAPMEERNSIFINWNGGKALEFDEDGDPYTGTVFFDARTIVRLKNGLIDGDVFDDDGEFVEARAAVEDVFRVEFWRKGCLHRDGGLPAVILLEPYYKYEYWENGRRVK